MSLDGVFIKSLAKYTEDITVLVHLSSSASLFDDF